MVELHPQQVLGRELHELLAAELEGAAQRLETEARHVEHRRGRDEDDAAAGARAVEHGGGDRHQLAEVADVDDQGLGRRLEGDRHRVGGRHLGRPVVVTAQQRAEHDGRADERRDHDDERRDGQALATTLLLTLATAAMATTGAGGREGHRIGGSRRGPPRRGRRRRGRDVTDLVAHATSP